MNVDAYAQRNAVSAREIRGGPAVRGTTAGRQARMAAPTIAAPPPVDASQAARGWTVLLVDDDAQVRRATGRVLRGIGVQVIEAEDGQAALDLLREHRGPLHLVLTDVIMPRMNGRELAFALAHLRPDLRVIFMTGYAGEHETRELVAAHATVVLKPFAIGELVATVVAALSEVPDAA